MGLGWGGVRMGDRGDLQHRSGSIREESALRASK